MFKQVGTYFQNRSATYIFEQAVWKGVEQFMSVKEYSVTYKSGKGFCPKCFFKEKVKCSYHFPFK